MRMRLWAAAAAASIGMALPVSAASYVNEGALTVSGLNYRLIDLDPDDGIAPWVQFNSLSRIEIGYSVNRGEPVVSPVAGGLFSTQNGGLSSPDGSVEPLVSNSGLSVRTALTTEAYVPGTEPDLLAAAGLAYWPDDFSVPVQSYGLALSARTALVIEAEATAMATVNTALLSGSAFSQAFTEDQDVYIEQRALTFLSFWSGGFNDVPDDFALQHGLVDTVDAYTSVLLSASDTDTQSMSKTPSVGYYNGGAESVELVLEFAMQSWASISVLTRWTPPPVDPGNPPAVPEAGTQARMLLGLGGLALVARRRR